MEIIFIIIGVWCSFTFICRCVALAFIPYLNKLRKKNPETKDNSIYDLECDKSFWTTNADKEYYIIPNISFCKWSDGISFSIRWFKYTYYINYLYKTADDQ